MNRRRWVALALGLAVVAGACNGAGGEGPQATVPIETTTTAVAGIDVTVVPDEITVEYAQAVVDALNRVLGDSIRELVANQAPNQRSDSLLEAIYVEPELEDKRSVYGELSARGLENFRPDGGDPTAEVLRIVRQGAGCALLEVMRDFSPVLIEAREPPQRGWMGIVVRQPPLAGNPTPWALDWDGATLDDEVPEEPCP